LERRIDVLLSSFEIDLERRRRRRRRRRKPQRAANGATAASRNSRVASIRKCGSAEVRKCGSAQVADIALNWWLIVHPGARNHPDLHFR